jgi:radical SAM protein with 4Fe4S-binding SPASM domain
MSMLNKLKNKFLQPALQTLIFESTLRCNLNCLYCYNVCKNKIPYKTTELNTESTKKLIKKAIKETRCSNFTITGGEPYLREDIIELIKFTQEQGVSINIISNGTLLNKETIIASVEAGVSLFELPLLSSERNIHNSLTRTDAFDKVTEAMAYISGQKAYLVAVFVATKKNIHTWQETIEMAVALGANGIMFNRFNPGGEGRLHIDELQLSPAELEPALEIANDAVTKYKISVSCSIAMPPCLIKTEKYPNLGFGFCAAGTNRAYYTIDPSGNLRMCNHSQTILGNILDENFFKVAKNKKAKEFVKALPAFCQTCAISKECQGGCKAAAEVCFQNIYEEDPFLKSFKHQAVQK